MAPAAPASETRVRGSPPPGQTPGLPNTSAQKLEPSIQKDPVRMAHPYWPHLSPRAAGAGMRGSGGGPPGARREDVAPKAGLQQRRQGEAESPAAGTSQQPGGSGRRPTPGAAGPDPLRQTGKPCCLAQPSAPTLPGGNSPFSFRQPAASRLPSGPFKNGTSAASLPAPVLGRASPTAKAAFAGRHVTADGGRRGSKLAATRSPVGSRLIATG